MRNQSLKLDGLRLLVVDNDPDAREILMFLFSGDGAKIVAAAMAAEAIADFSV